jgi:hypothetical protein
VILLLGEVDSMVLESPASLSPQCKTRDWEIHKILKRRLELTGPSLEGLKSPDGDFKLVETALVETGGRVLNKERGRNERRGAAVGERDRCSGEEKEIWRGNSRLFEPENHLRQDTTVGVWQ